ncbi:casein kinase 2 regulatory subunit [Perkinsus olseni]|uniref:Casein kinase II subunit beta n=1 Tax=Perkinsus olseni TaxID=32597 RepID=A0A7J6RXZ7_PEROL|nr:casein kinase 2 regulatory subunit [Perkinsus olseni]
MYRAYDMRLNRDHNDDGDVPIALEDDNDSDDVIGGGADQQPIGSEYESEELTDDSEEEEEDITWIEWFCNAKGNEYFIQVDEDYIRDSFNLTDLRDVVPYYDIALNTILDLEERSYIGRLNDSRSSVIENSTKLLYGLIQARFLITNRGLEALHDKFTAFTYGMCPNVDCESARQAVSRRTLIPRSALVHAGTPYWM